MSGIPVRGVVLLLLAACLAAGCNGRHFRRWSDLPPGPPAPPVDSATAAHYATLEPGLLPTVPSAPVVGWTGPGNQPFEVALRTAAPEAGHARPFGTITLPIALRNRRASLSQYPCTSCHQGRKVVMTNRRIGDAHENIKPLHPQGTATVCSTCHAGEDVGLLALTRGERATLDQSYRLCAQCHFQQVEAWAGGGHGKRLDGWEGRRVVMACPDCHDPHNPAVQPRIPFRAPQLERGKGYDR
jgi:hypothetical protein